MPGLTPVDRFALEAASGWLMLGNPAEALNELKQLPADRRSHPDVLLVEWEVHAQSRAWEQAVETADRITRLAPERSEGFVKKAFALHELKRTEDAWKCLEPVASVFISEWVVSYNLACYACQLGRPEEGMRWFQRAIRIGNKEELREMGLEDPDLEPIRAEIKRVFGHSRRLS